MTPHSRQARVLLIEDDPIDVEVVRRGFAQSPSQPDVEVISEAAAAIDHLARAVDDPDALPDLILLDLGLPDDDGLYVLDRIRALSEDLVGIPVVILTASDADETVLASYRASANAFLSKPVDPTHMAELVESLEEFFLRTAHLPRRHLDGR